MATRNGSAEWRGDLQGGGGDLTVGDGVFKGAYSFSSRFEEGEGTNPEELIAAAHAACFSMALSNILAEHGHPAESVRTEAKVHLGPVDAGPTIQRIDAGDRGPRARHRPGAFRRARRGGEGRLPGLPRARRRRGDQPEREASGVTSLGVDRS